MQTIMEYFCTILGKKGEFRAMAALNVIVTFQWTFTLRCFVNQINPLITLLISSNWLKTTTPGESSRPLMPQLTYGLSSEYGYYQGTGTYIGGGRVVQASPILYTKFWLCPFLEIGIYSWRILQDALTYTGIQFCIHIEKRQSMIYI